MSDVAHRSRVRMDSSDTDQRHNDPKNNLKLIDVLGRQHGIYCRLLSRQN